LEELLTNIFSRAVSLGIRLPDSKLSEYHDLLQDALRNRAELEQQEEDVTLHDILIGELRKQIVAEADKLK
jgi:hypothetical protein